MAGKQTINVVLEKHPGMNATSITIPFDVEDVFGAKRVPVKATVNGACYRGSIVRMGGRFCLGIPKAFREEAGIEAGELIAVTIELDTEERTVEVPHDLLDALSTAGLTEAWDKQSYTHRKEHARAVADAKTPETRGRRVQKAVETIAAVKKK
jgi:bifunctional DNA-binding transcriptional regulator/antitoxin component of YhaV-PrlF toxin-antitoxin module